jgi:hypothetical protein
LGEPLNHHYIPRFYLAAWRGKDGRITYYKVENRRVVVDRISTKGTGYEQGLYTFEAGPQDLTRLIEQNSASGGASLEALKEILQRYLDSGMKDSDFRQLFETRFASAIDDAASKVLSKIRAAGVSALTHEERLAWTQFVMSLPLRNPAAVADIKESARNSMVNDVEERFRNEFGGKIDDDDTGLLLKRLLSADETFQHISADHGLQVIEGIIRDPDYQSEIESLTWWTIDFSAANYTALTSDRPYLRTRPLQDPSYWFYLPLGPTLGFFGSRDPKIRDVMSSKGLNFLIKSMNHFVVRFADKYVYGVDTSHLRFVENRWRPVKDSS